MMVQGVVMVIIAVGIGGANGSSSPCCRNFWVEIHPFFMVFVQGRMMYLDLADKEKQDQASRLER